MCKSQAKVCDRIERNPQDVQVSTFQRWDHATLPQHRLLTHSAIHLLIKGAALRGKQCKGLIVSVNFTGSNSINSHTHTHTLPPPSLSLSLSTACITTGNLQYNYKFCTPIQQHNQEHVQENDGHCMYLATRKQARSQHSGVSQQSPRSPLYLYTPQTCVPS